jgi:hypothetical protein
VAIDKGIASGGDRYLLDPGEVVLIDKGFASGGDRYLLDPGEVVETGQLATFSLATARLRHIGYFILQIAHCQWTDFIPVNIFFPGFLVINKNKQQ